MSEKPRPKDLFQEQYLNNLYLQTINGNVRAADELSKIAFGGSTLAQELVRKIEAVREIEKKSAAVRTLIK